MNGLQKLPDFQRSAPSLEWGLWRKLPAIMATGTALPLLGMLVVRMWAPEPMTAATERMVTLANDFAIAVVVLHWTLALTVAIGCVIVMLMKGPACVADAYELPHRDQPLPPEAAP